MLAFRGGTSALSRHLRPRRLTLGAITTASVVTACTAFVVWQVHPAEVLRDTVPARGDLVSHFYGPDFLRSHLLPDGQWAGWSPDWFAGFPLYLLYPLLAPALVVIVDVALPYAVAFKVVAVAGVVALPLSAWALGRLAALPAPYPALFSVAALGYVFETSCNLCGGNMAATVAGESAFGLGLPLALLATGAFVRALRTDGGWPLAALLLTLALLAHPVPALWTVALVVGAVAVFAVAARPGAWRRASVTAGAGLLLAGLWWVPFLLLRGHMTVPNFVKRTTYRFWLLPYRWWWELLLAALIVVGIVMAARAGRRLPLVIAGVTALAAIGFVVAPTGQLWNLRLIPFWYLGRFLLAAAGVAELALAARSMGRARVVTGRAATLAPVVGLLVVLLLMGSVWGTLPGASVERHDAGERATVAWAGLSFGGTVQRWWAEEGFSGLQRRRDWPEFDRLVGALERVARRHGCGRAAWDRQDRQGRDREGRSDNLVFGGDGALTLLPFFTDGCIGTLDGILRDSSATTPYIQLTQSLTTFLPEQWVVGLPYEQFNLARGIDQLRRVGTRYYLTRGGDAEAAAREFTRDLRLVASPGPWQVWLLLDSEVVSPLPVEPAVMVLAEGEDWDDMSALYSRTREADVVPLAENGPPEWRRVPSGQFPTPRPLPQARVSGVRLERDEVSFEVDRTGVPTLVRVSWFPGWNVKGGRGPYRVTPNLMVVIPEDDEVRLYRTRTGAEWMGIASFLAGVGVLVALVATERRRRTLAHHGEGEPWLRRS